MSERNTLTAMPFAQRCYKTLTMQQTPRMVSEVNGGRASNPVALRLLSGVRLPPTLDLPQTTKVTMPSSLLLPPASTSTPLGDSSKQVKISSVYKVMSEACDARRPVSLVHPALLHSSRAAQPSPRKNETPRKEATIDTVIEEIRTSLTLNSKNITIDQSATQSPRGASASPAQTHNFSFTINMHNKAVVAPNEGGMSKMTRADNSGSF